MAFMVTGSWNSWIQPDKRANCGVPSPSQAKKDSTTTPSSGSSANTPKKLRAGASSQLLGPVRKRLYEDRPEPAVRAAGPPWSAGRACRGEIGRASCRERVESAVGQGGG